MTETTEIKTEGDPNFEKIRPTEIKKLLASYGVPERHVRMVLDGWLYNGDPMQNYDEADACALADISRRTMSRLVTSGEGPEFIKIKGRRYYQRGSLAKWYKSRTFVSVAEAKAAGY